MEQIEKLETMVSGWFKDLPRLPKGLTDWLADNVWWLTIIGVVLSVFGILSILSVAFIALGLSGLAIGSVSSIYGGYTVGALAGVALTALLVSVVGIALTTILMALAISPLKEKKKKGWTLLFVVLLLSFGFSAVTNLISFNIVGILVAVIWAAVEAYVLFEIRSYFGVKHKTEPAKPTSKKA